MKRNKWYKVVCSLLLVLSLFACSNKQREESGLGPIPNTEKYRVNEEIPCEQYDYDKSGGDWDVNLTGIGEKRKLGLNTYCYLGVQILDDYETYNKIRSDAVANQPQRFKKTQNAFSPVGVTEEDFKQYDFLMVDFLKYGAIALYPRLENLTVEDGKVSVDLLYDAFISSTADNSSVLYFIPIPKGCTEAEVTPIRTSFSAD